MCWSRLNAWESSINWGACGGGVARQARYGLLGLRYQSRGDARHPRESSTWQPCCCCRLQPGLKHKKLLMGKGGSRSSGLKYQRVQQRIRRMSVMLWRQKRRKLRLSDCVGGRLVRRWCRRYRDASRSPLIRSRVTANAQQCRCSHGFVGGEA